MNGQVNYLSQKHQIKKVPHLSVISDSIILTSQDDSIDAHFALFALTWKILQSSIMHKLPIRGAISYGDLYLNDVKNIVVGNPLKEAYELEGQCDWIGICLHAHTEPIILKIIEELNCQTLFDIWLPIYDIPLKDARKRPLRAINWRMNITFEKGVTAYLNPDTSPEDSKQKYLNSLEFSYFCRNRGAYINWEDMPGYFNTIQVSENPPIVNDDGSQNAIPNGDDY
jgi:hypothetical protein